MCDYGYNIEIGENFYANHNLIILDGNKVEFGDNVFIAPNSVIQILKQLTKKSPFHKI